MGHPKFGNLAKLRGIIYFKLSPFELKAFPNPVKGLINIFSRINDSIFKVGPIFFGGFLIYYFTEAWHKQLQRKNPADYVNDEEEEEEDENKGEE